MNSPVAPKSFQTEIDEDKLVEELKFFRSEIYR